jgi:hypothetical protein
VFNDQVLQLLRNDRMRSFRIEVETDSTIQPDEDLEKRRRIEFLGVVGPYMERTVAVVQQVPQLAPTMAEILMFSARIFRAGRGLEDVLERGIGEIAQAAQQRQQMMQQQGNANPMIALEQQDLQRQAAKDLADSRLKRDKQQSEAALKERGQNMDYVLTVRQQNMEQARKAREHADKMRHDIIALGMPS